MCGWCPHFQSISEATWLKSIISKAFWSGPHSGKDSFRLTVKADFTMYVCTLTWNKRLTYSPLFTSKIQFSSVVEHLGKWDNNLAPDPPFTNSRTKRWGCFNGWADRESRPSSLHSRLQFTDCNGSITLIHNSTFTKSTSVHALIAKISAFFVWLVLAECRKDDTD